MSFQCTACFGKSYDKPWKLQRHIRETKKCFERTHPDLPADHFTQYQCTSCSYNSPRKPDFTRHRHRVHGDTANPTAPGHVSTSSADASREGSTHVDHHLPCELLRTNLHERLNQLSQSNVEQSNSDPDGMDICDPSINSATCPVLSSPSGVQPITLALTNEESGNIVRFDPHLTTSSQTPVMKRKFPDQYSLTLVYKRFRAEADGTSRFGVKEMSTNETDILEPDSEQDRELETVHDPEFDFIDEISLELWTTGGWIDPLYDDSSLKRSEADLSIADALTKLALTSPGKDHETSTTIESDAREWIQFVYLRNESKTLSSENNYSYHSWHTMFWKESISAPSVHASPSIPRSNLRRQSTTTSSMGSHESCPSSKGSLFGRPSTHSYTPWKTWSSVSASQASAVKSLHSTGMPAPMLNSVDSELLLSRARTSGEKPESCKTLHLTPQEQSSLAAVDKDVEHLHVLTEDLDFDHNHRNYEGQTALVWAAERGRHRTVEVLLSNACNTVDVNSRDNRGMTAIMFACQGGDQKTFQALLGVPAIDLWAQNHAGHTALMLAIQSSTDDDSTITIVKALIARIQAQPDYHTTAAKWHPQFNAQDVDGLTPLHWAVKLNRRDCISALLGTGRVDVALKASEGTTPAMQAIQDMVAGAVLELLFDYEACDPTATNLRGETLVEVAQRVLGEREGMLVDYRHRCDLDDPIRLQAAWENLRLCVAYEHYHAGPPTGSEARNPSVKAGPCKRSWRVNALPL
jgi:ankyrin repeat protein